MLDGDKFYGEKYVGCGGLQFKNRTSRGNLIGKI